jgi:methylenetetrahydrofolate reductase (NADPH)
VSDQFGSKLRAGDFVITAEISPPLSSDPEDLLEKAMPLGGLANAVNITDPR